MQQVKPTPYTVSFVATEETAATPLPCRTYAKCAMARKSPFDEVSACLSQLNKGAFCVSPTRLWVSL